MPRSSRPFAPSLSRRVRHALALALLAAALPVAAMKPQGMTDAEIAVLPKYCPDTMGFTIYSDAYSGRASPRAPFWTSVMGKNFWHMHHYCAGLVQLNRANKRGVRKELKEGAARNAVDEFVYVLENTSKNFVMRPEVWTRLGETYVVLNEPNRARDAFAAAREFKPDYWPAYFHWALYLNRNGRRAEALEVLKAGLEYSPGQKTMSEQYRQLGGNPEKIVPKAVPQPPKPPAAQAAAPEAANPAPDAGSEPGAAAEPGETTAPATVPPLSEANPPAPR